LGRIKTGILLAYTFVADELRTALRQLTAPIVACAASALSETSAFSREACLSSDFMQCDNDLPVGPNSPYLLEYRQPAGLVSFSIGLVLLTAVVTLLLIVAEAHIQRRQSLASALLPFYGFFFFVKTGTGGDPAPLTRWTFS
jgi:hypothetical protein